MFIVSVVGRPNVGKSCLFNRILGKRVAVVDDRPGVTRDRHYKDASWNTCGFTLVDTGGLDTASKETMAQEIAKQVEIACEESDVIIFVVDATVGITALDNSISRKLRKQDRSKVVLAINKAESKKAEYDIGSFYALGLGAGFPVSALHGKGVGDLMDHVCGMLKIIDRPVRMPIAGDDSLHIAIVGRPNAGKSSLVNKLIRQERMIVSSLPGTTRDAVDTDLLYNGTPITLIDTAGLRKKANVNDDVEYYSNLRALDSIKRCTICMLVIDATGGMQEQDLKIVRQILASRKGIIICWNKWDILEKDHTTFDHLVANAQETYMELRHVPMVSISALTGQRVTNVLDMAMDLQQRMRMHVPLVEFREHVHEWIKVHPHPMTANLPVQIMFCDQFTVARYPVFRFFAKNSNLARESYKRYLTNKIYDTYEFDGCPVTVEFHPHDGPRCLEARELAESLSPEEASE
jgi:GTP-binding protein